MCIKSRSENPWKDALDHMYTSLTLEYYNELCDYCGKHNHEVRGHRCAGCKTKVFCGLECLNKDTVHLKLCDRENVDERRRKKDSEKRMRDGKLLWAEFKKKMGM